LDSYLRRLQEAVASATRGMNAEELTRHPEGKWSAGEVLEHLSLTYSGTVKGFERCLQAGKLPARPPTLKERVTTALVVEAGYMPGGRQSPERTRPQGKPVEQVLQEIGPQIAAMDEIIRQCETRFGKRTRLLDHPVLGPLTAAQWRRFHWVHGRHHVKQIWRLRGKT
jgi:hypothetical protein